MSAHRAIVNVMQSRELVREVLVARVRSTTKVRNPGMGNDDETFDGIPNGISPAPAGAFPPS